MLTLSNGIVYQDLGTHDAAEYAEYARQERERRRQAQQNAAPSSQPAPQQNSVPKTVPDRGPDVKTAPSAPMDAAEQTRRSQLQEGARSAYENYLGSYASQAMDAEKNIAQTGKSVMDTAYVFNEAWNAVKNNTAFAGSIGQQQAFVTNAAINFANASAVAHGWELVDQANVDGKNAWTGYNSQTGTWDFVFRDKNGNFFTKHTTMDQVASQLKNNGYYPDDADKSKDKSGKGGDETSASSGKGGESKPPAEPNVGDISKRYNGFYTKTYDENGKETGYSLSDEGEQFMLGELESATGVERRYLLNALASHRARSALAEAGSQNPDDPNKPTFKSEYDKALQELKNSHADPSSVQTTDNQEPSDALEAFAKSVSVSKTGDADIQYSGLGASWKNLDDARKEREANRKAAAEQNRRARSVYVNGQWVTQGDIDDGKVSGPTTGVIRGVKDVSPEAIESRRIAQEMTKVNYEKNGLNKPKEPLVSDDERVKGLDEMLDRYGREDDEEWDRNNADYFDKDGAQIDPSDVTEDANGNLVDKNGDPVRKEYWNDGTGGYDVKLSGDKVRVDMSEVRDTDARREEEIFDAVMQMSPETRRRLATETDEKGRLTYRASKVRQAIGAYVDKENIRDFSNAEGTMDGGAKRSDGSDRTAASVNKTYRDSKGGLVMEETFDGGRMTEQGREARINALLDAELGPGGFADTRSYADRNLAPEDDVELLRRRAQYRSRIANYDRPDSWRGEDYEIVEEGEAPRLTPEAQKQNSERRAERRSADLAQRQLKQAEENERSNAPSNVKSNIPELTQSQRDAEAAAAIQAMQDKGVGRVRSQKWKDEQALQRASQMTESEKQARAWANRDRSQPASASEPPASEPDNKPTSGPAPLPDNPKERRDAVKKDKNYSKVVETENDDGSYVLTDRSVSFLKEHHLKPSDLSSKDIQDWIHNGNDVIVKMDPVENDRKRMAEVTRRTKEESMKNGGAMRTMTNRNLALMGPESVAKLTDEYIERVYKNDADYVKKRRDEAKEQIRRKGKVSGK